MKVLFLYTELAGYFLSCVNELINKTNSHVHIVRWPVNNEAPFSFLFNDKIKVYDRYKYSPKEILNLVSEICPDIIYCSGWMDKDYLSVCKRFRKKIPVIVGIDNKWTRSFRQQLGAIFNAITIHKYFSHCWIPGAPQMEFARHIGFNANQILTGFYSCDYDFFHSLFKENRKKKKQNFPHRFIFSGRYYEFKGIKYLWQAFTEIKSEFKCDWELWCLGTGDVKPIVHPSIKHFGFVQPQELGKYIEQTGVFILPSTFEPWGVAVHEFASAGFPLICSTEVGASSVFLKDEENGFLFEAGNILQLKEKMKKIITLSDEELFEMGEYSAKLASQITPAKWVDTLLSVFQKKNYD